MSFPSPNNRYFLSLAKITVHLRLHLFFKFLTRASFQQLYNESQMAPTLCTEKVAPAEPPSLAFRENVK